MKKEETVAKVKEIKETKKRNINHVMLENKTLKNEKLFPVPLMCPHGLQFLNRYGTIKSQIWENIARKESYFPYHRRVISCTTLFASLTVAVVQELSLQWYGN